MNSGKTAVVLVGGYLLGRFHKAKWAMALAGATAGRKMRAKGGEGVSGILQSPEVSKLTGNLRGQLLGVGKAAAMAAASRRMDALTGKLADRTEALRAGPGDEAEDEDENQDGEGRDQDDEQSDEEDDAADEAPRKRKRATTKSGSRTTKSGSRSTKSQSSTAKSGSGTSRSGSGAAKKTASGTARKTTARSTSTSSGATKKKAASGGRTRSQTARKSTASKQAGGRAKGR